MNKKTCTDKVIKIIVIFLVFSMTIQCHLFLFSDTAFAEVKKDNYIVITQDSETTTEIKENYTVVSENGEALTLALSANDVVQLDRHKEILCLEKDTVIDIPSDIEWNTVKPLTLNWSLEAINAEKEMTGETPATVKVAMIDSGVDYSKNVTVHERKNFISEKPVTTIFFEDLTGHGTSVASLLAGKAEDSDVKGVNRNIQLYSARVLDENNQGTISSVVEAIYWAMEKNVNIINISFGTPIYSEALKTAIDAASEQGILIVAAAGNRGSEGVDYPAAFENVLAVGSSNAAGEVSEFSGRGQSVDIVAPGEAVLAQCNFGEDLVLSGTSLSAPQVSGLAAALWSEDLNQPAAFIAALIKLSARDISDSSDSYGLIDYEYAFEVYENIARTYDSLKNEIANNSSLKEKTKTTTEKNNFNMKPYSSVELEEKLIESVHDNNLGTNGNPVEDLSDPSVIGSWTAKDHEKQITNTIMKAGAIYSDKEESGVKGMTSHSEFHGFSWHGSDDDGLNTGDCNYVSNYKYLVLIANKVGEGGDWTKIAESAVVGINSTCYKKLVNDMKNIVSYAEKKYPNSLLDQRRFLMGVAVHSATDAFAHSAFKQKEVGSYSWIRIQHTLDPNDIDPADDPTVKPKRAELAYEVEKNALARCNKTRTVRIDLDFHDNTREGYILPTLFRQNKMLTFAKASNPAIEADYPTVTSDYKLLQTGGV